jgi:hypothetical protein
MSFTSTCLSWNNVSALKLIILIIFAVGLNYYIFYSNTIADTGDKVKSGPLDTCLVTCQHSICKKLASQCRESNYSLGLGISHDECIFTGWEFSHVMLHIFLGYFFNAYISVSLSILFEIYEHYVYNCASLLDLFWNTLGLLMGIYLRHKQGCHN